MNDLETQVCNVLRGTLGLDNMALNSASPLLGALPQLDSMAVLALLTALEEHFGIAILDDEVQARHFASVGTLTAFVRSKLP